MDCVYDFIGYKHISLGLGLLKVTWQVHSCFETVTKLLLTLLAWPSELNYVGEKKAYFLSLKSLIHNNNSVNVLCPNLLKYFYVLLSTSQG